MTPCNCFYWTLKLHQCTKLKGKPVITANDQPACTCGRGGGCHHPDCPAWDPHVDNYEEESDMERDRR